MAVDEDGFPVTRTPAGVVRAAAGAKTLSVIDARICGCRACPRLVAWREEVARVKRASFRDQDYRGRPVPGLGPADARIAVVGLAPAAHGGNRTGRVFTGDRSGDWIFAALWRAAPARAGGNRAGPRLPGRPRRRLVLRRPLAGGRGQPAAVPPHRRRAGAPRRAGRRVGALPPTGQRPHPRGAGHVLAVAGP